MTRPFIVRTTPRFERAARSLVATHPAFRIVLQRAVQILEIDPHNRSRAHDIRKLVAVPAGEGAWRLAIGRFRFRYDIDDRDVILHYCGLRREDTYR